MKKFSNKTIARAFLYIRILDDRIQNKQKYISSQELSDISGLTDVQIRKDISLFGKVGKPRVGYDTKELRGFLEAFVLKSTVRAVLFGVGNLGQAILKYPGFQTEKIKIVAAFDKDSRKVGKKINGVAIYAMKDVSRVIHRSRAQIAIIATPSEASQEIAGIITKSGLKGIINFAPSSLVVPKGVSVRNIDLSIEFLSLFYDIHSSRKRRKS
ncbi:MAG TPA: redox-sensing transcriptional repressor Rex [Candidatus Omnitrophota bacterium]|nr:redox-sensing transcriptional repressor Rex [Candidatus Omnitrophota bacterium]HPN88708.1 redox-sensing transcriptional repressor Rex [Candidatus Omnitrophota bacterium]